MARPSEKSVSGFVAPSSVPSRGLDLVIVNALPPLFVSRSWIVWAVRPPVGAKSISYEHPLVVSVQWGIVFHPPSPFEYSRRATGVVAADPVKTVYALPPSE